MPKKILFLFLFVSRLLGQESNNENLFIQESLSKVTLEGKKSFFRNIYFLKEGDLEIAFKINTSLLQLREKGIKYKIKSYVATEEGKIIASVLPKEKKNFEPVAQQIDLKGFYAFDPAYNTYRVVLIFQDPSGAEFQRHYVLSYAAPLQNPDYLGLKGLEKDSTDFFHYDKERPLFLISTKAGGTYDFSTFYLQRYMYKVILTPIDSLGNTVGVDFGDQFFHPFPNEKEINLKDYFKDIKPNGFIKLSILIKIKDGHKALEEKQSFNLKLIDGISSRRFLINQKKDTCFLTYNQQQLHISLPGGFSIAKDFQYKFSVIQTNELGEKIQGTEVLGEKEWKKFSPHAENIDLSSFITISNPFTQQFYKVVFWLKDKQEQEEKKTFWVNYSYLISSNLPLLMLESPESAATWTGREDDKKTTVKVIESGNKIVHAFASPSIKAFGSLSLRGYNNGEFPKKNAALTFIDEKQREREVGIFGFSPHSEWFLQAVDERMGFAYNYLAFELFKQMGNSAPRTQLVEVFFNKQYIGLYLFSEKISRGNDRVNLNRIDASILPQNATYLLKTSAQSEFFSNYHQLEFVYPAPHKVTDKQKEFVLNHFKQIEQKIVGEETEKWEQLLHINSFLNLFILTDLFQPKQSYASQQELYFIANKQNKIEVIIGDMQPDEKQNDNLIFYNNDAYNGTGLKSRDFYLTFREDLFANLLASHYQSHREKLLSDAYFIQKIDQLKMDLKEAKDRDQKRWQLKTDYDELLDKLKIKLLNRLKILDDIFIHKKGTLVQQKGLELRINKQRNVLKLNYTASQPTSINIEYIWPAESNKETFQFKQILQPGTSHLISTEIIPEEVKMLKLYLHGKWRNVPIIQD